MIAPRCSRGPAARRARAAFAIAIASALAVAGAAATSACDLAPLAEPARDAPVRESLARTLGMFSTELPDDAREQALLALEHDAFRREHRFLEAASPGHLFRSTRVPQAEIEAGLWPPADLFQLGAQLFHLTFSPELGFGAAGSPPLRRFHQGRRGGPDASRCAACHWRGGPAGAGDGADNAYLDGDGDAQSSALARNPPSLAGAGLVEILATEMTRDLAARRAELIAAAQASNKPVRGELVAKGVSFGFLTARPDGSADATEVNGIDFDLVVRPFGWKGNLASVRDAVEDALLIHHGMQSDHLVASASADRIGPFGGADPDGDGVANEIEEGQITALTIFVAMQEVPTIEPPFDPDGALLFAEGRARFEAIGCASCHVPSLPLRSTEYVLASRGGGPPYVVDLARDGAEPRLAPSPESGELRAMIFSDLKRHDMGPGLAEPRPDRAVPGKTFMTRPLWGIARSRPYLHDARAPTLEDAILLHGGEAQAARDAYAALGEHERAPIRVFLTALTRARRMVSP